MNLKIVWKNGDTEIREDVTEIHFNHSGRGDIAFEQDGKQMGMSVPLDRIKEFECIKGNDFHTKGVN